MPYGTIKIDTITFTDAGVDKSIAVSGLVQNPTFTGNVTVTGTVSGTTVRATSVSGVTVSGTTANFASGVYTTQISGAIVKVPAGTAGAPTVQVGTGASIAPGLYSPNADELGISTGGSFRLVVDSTGRVGIGTSAPGVKLEVFGASNANEIRSSDGTIISQWYQDTAGVSIFGTVSNHPQVFRTNSTERVRIDSSGNVGIGKSSIYNRFLVYGPQATDALLSATLGPVTALNSTNNADTVGLQTGFTIARDGKSGVSYGNHVNFNIGRYSQVGSASNTQLTIRLTQGNANDPDTDVMTLLANGHVGIGTSSPNARLEVQAPSAGRSYTSSVLDFSNIHLNGITSGTTTNALTFTSGGGGGAAVAFSRGVAFDTEISFWTNSAGGANAATQRMVIDSSGNVGIGTTGPTNLLTVHDSGTPVADFVAGYMGSTAVGTGESRTWLTLQKGPIGGNYGGAIGGYLSQGVGGGLIFGTQNATATPVERMRIDNSGNVLVGTSASRGGRSEFVSGTANTNADYSGAAASFVGVGTIGTAATRATISVEDNSAVAIDVGGSIGFGGRYITASTTYAQWAAVAGKKETGTSNEYGGYLGFYTRTHATATIDERMRIDSFGRLLVGTSTSIQNLLQGALQIVGTSEDSYIAVTRYSSGADAPAGIILGRSKSATKGTNTIVAGEDSLGAISFSGADGTNFEQAASIVAYVDGTPGNNDMPGRLVFSTTADGAVTPTERMRIESNGNARFSNLATIYPAADNAVTNGGSGFRWSQVWAANGTIQTSDQRTKTDVTNAALGSDFIKLLRPVSYRWVEGGKRDTGKRDEDGNYIYESVPGERTHWGFIAQEVKEAVDTIGVDFGGWVLTDKDDPDSQQALRYDQFIAPLTAALQEAIAKIETLEAKVAALEEV